MDINNINIYDVYEIDFVDPNGRQSFKGPALCLAKNENTNLVLFAISPIKALVIRSVYVKRKSKEKIKVSLSARKTMKKLSGF